ncbi:MAG: ABC transporter substrate-binding protein [Chloroflexota bacterium]
MKRVWTILKRIGKFLLWTILILVVLIGSLVLWLRAEPAAVTECDPSLRFFEDADGAECIPYEPTDIFSVSVSSSQLLLALGVPTVVRVAAFEDFVIGDIPGLEPRMDTVHEGVREINITRDALNFELLVEADPDVIISEFPAGEVNKLLGTIAPVVLLNPEDSWQDYMRIAGDIIGQQADAEALLEEFDERVELLRAQFDDPSDITVSIVRIHPDNTQLQLRDSFSGQIIQKVGFSIPEAQKELADAEPGVGFFMVSQERVDLIDGEHIIIVSGTTNEILAEQGSSLEDLVDDFNNDPLYQTLEGAQNGNVSAVGTYWRLAGIYSAHAILDDLFIHVAGVDPDEVAPNPLPYE